MWRMLFVPVLMLAAVACGSDETTSGSSTGGSNAGGSNAGGSNAGGSNAGGNGNSGGGMPGPSCGDLTPGCDFGQLCVAFHATAGPMTTTTYECHPNPCAGGVDCSCAGSICAAKFNLEICSSGTGDVDINCDNGAQ
jgi:hypothetical protein